MKRAASSLVLLLLLSTAAACADNLQFSADRMTTVLAKGKEHTILSGNARIQNGDTVITANQIELYGPNFRYAQCTGQVKVVDAKRGITLTSQNLYYDRTEDLSRVEGYAEMQDTKNELVVKGGFLENRGKDDVTIIQIGVRILKIADKQQMACRSEFARYNRKTDSLVLSGTPVVYWKGDEYRASQIAINLKTDEINLEGEVSGKIVSESGSQQSGGSSGGSGGGSSGSSAPPPAAGGSAPSGGATSTTGSGGGGSTAGGGSSPAGGAAAAGAGTSPAGPDASGGGSGNGSPATGGSAPGTNGAAGASP